MTGMPPGVSPIPDVIDQSSMMNGVDVDTVDFPMSMADPETQSFPSIAAGLNERPPLPTTTAPFSAGPGGSLTGIGAGPLPTGFGILPSASTGSTLTEFTKRRNWSKLVLEELRDLLFILSPDGRIQWASPSCKLLTGYDSLFIMTQFLTDFVHHDDRAMFLREFNESIASGNQMRFFYRFKKEDGSFTIFEAHGHPHLTSDPLAFPAGVRNCRGVFMMSRPYPTKNAALLDSFLEHKIENERLTRRIAELKREEQEENEQQELQWKSQGQTSASVSDLRGGDGRDSEPASASASTYDGMPPPAKPGVSNIALTRQNLDEALATHRPDSINDKMARYEGATHIETIEMLTGLRYREGERSEGISTGATSPALIRGDVGIPVQADRESRTSVDKKKKIKVADEYVCTDCGTLDSPEWRKGPNGPKTLCNACGCKYPSPLGCVHVLTSGKYDGPRRRRRDRQCWARLRATAALLRYQCTAARAANGLCPTIYIPQTWRLRITVRLNLESKSSVQTETEPNG
jgi:PAS domain S-box-containing protein